MNQLNLQLSTRILVYFQNVFLRTRFFPAFRANRSLWPTHNIYFYRWVADEQFAALFNELQARGDKGKLMQLFGH